jgi:hypothetical protein
MISKKLLKKIEETNSEVELFIEEKEFAERNNLLKEDQTVVIKEKNNQFSDGIIERYNKETDELISKESSGFLDSPLSYFKENQNEYLYMESESFDILGVDAIALEFDEVFEVHTAMFGLAVQKKFGQTLRDYLNEHFNSEKMNYSLMFSGEDGLWEVNIPLNYLDQFKENFTLKETMHFLFTFLFSMVEATEK